MHRASRGEERVKSWPDKMRLAIRHPARHVPACPGANDPWRRATNEPYLDLTGLWTGTKMARVKTGIRDG